MFSSRRRFLASMAATPVVLPSQQASFGSQSNSPVQSTAAAGQGRRQGPLDVALYFDVEDVFNPPEAGNDDSIKELATILTEEGLRGNFLFIGDRAQLLKERRRQDVIDSMGPHEVGLHTRSARHPCGPEYVAGKSWDEGVAECLKREKEGVEIIRNVFGKPCVSLSMHYEYGPPHAIRAAALLGLPYAYGIPAAPPLYNVSWYAGALVLPCDSPALDGRPISGYLEGFDDRYANTPAFESHLRQLDQQVDRCLKESQPYLTLFLFHPQRVRLAEFVDLFWCPNGVNYPQERWGRYGRPRRHTAEEVKTELANFRRLARWIRNDPRLNPVTVPDLVRRYGQQPESMKREELAAAAQAVSAADGILIHERFSPAEMVIGLAQAMVAFDKDGQLPPAVARRNVLGPTRSPIWHPELLTATRPRLVQLARELLDQVNSTGHLPATLGPPLERVGVNHLYRGFAEAFLAVHRGSGFTGIRFRRTPPCPEIAAPIGVRFLKSAEGELMDPDIDVNTLYRDGKLQSWTLKPAIAN